MSKVFFILKFPIPLLVFSRIIIIFNKLSKVQQTYFKVQLEVQVKIILAKIGIKKSYFSKMFLWLEEASTLFIEFCICSRQ